MSNCKLFVSTLLSVTQSHSVLLRLMPARAQVALSKAEANIKQKQASRDGEIERAVKRASTNRDKLSKDLVQATSACANQKSSLEVEQAALKSLRQVTCLP